MVATATAPPGPRPVTGPVTAVGLGLVVALAAVFLDWRLVVPLAIALPLTAIALAAPAAGLDVVERAAATRQAGWVHLVHRRAFIGATWAALVGLNLLRLLSPNRAAGAALQGDASLDNVLQLGATGMAALVVTGALLDGWSRPVPRGAQLFLLFSGFALASLTWSPTFLFTAARGTQFVVLAAFTAYCASRAAAESGFVEDVLARALRWLTVYVLAAAALWLVEIGIADPRQNWRGNSPNTVGAAMMVPFLGLLAHRRRAWITRPLPWWAVVAVLMALLYWTKSRTFAGAAVVAAAALLVAAGLRDSRVLAAGTGLVTAAVAAVAGFNWDAVVAFAFRGESTTRVQNIAGRTELWGYVLDNPAGSEVWGVGLGASKGRLPQDWNPDNAHNAWIDLLQDLGVIGMGLMGAVVLTAVILAVVYRSVHGAWTLGVVLVATMTGISIAQPGWAAGLLAVGIVATSDRDLRAPPDVGPDPWARRVWPWESSPT